MKVEDQHSQCSQNCDIARSVLYKLGPMRMKKSYLFSRAGQIILAGKLMDVTVQAPARAKHIDYVTVMIQSTMK